MGAHDLEADAYGQEMPQHKVTLTQGFWLGETPVTQALYAKVMGTLPTPYPNRPQSVSWLEACDFLKRLNGLIPMPDLVFRLPTEAEWEYACRAGTTTATYAGDITPENVDFMKEIAWTTLDGMNCAQPVGLKRANPWGAYDMLGNVWEWCLDEISAGDEYPKDPQVDPLVLGGKDRVCRGGSYWWYPQQARAASRMTPYRPHYRLPDTGFRICLGRDLLAR